MNKSISQLEGWKWKGEIPQRETHGGVECRLYDLHDKSISKLDLSDIRFLITQNIGLEYLIPIAMDKIKENLFLEVEYYPGDLLCSLLLINNEPNYWKLHTEQAQDLVQLYTEQKSHFVYTDDITESIRQKIKIAYKDFLNKIDYGVPIKLDKK